ncbi:L-threonylcarbamoyladenylate synthase [Candidatus Magnetaquicoccus inordinatus]|uniref:L-threonylcarbamoyladenylate synthase n=1 Tax=Candidatus Magnetaquicoccus inordinatus TaxID=2496818 RepID=UPI00102B0D75|nr:L-threonylcarbamoyladenylate synthase [Candidatus Magnetaquicoccus inordinatus]
MNNFYIEKDNFDKAHLALSSGEIIAHPTETVYGFAVDPWNPHAVERLQRLKQRDGSKGFILLIPERATLSNLIAQVDPLACLLMDHFWPGPLTILFLAKEDVPKSLTGGGEYVAIRHSSSTHVQELMKRWQGALVSTSANQSGHPTINSASDIAAYWGDKVSCIIEGNVKQNSLPSTIVKVDTGKVKVIRQGAISRDQIDFILTNK